MSARGGLIKGVALALAHLLIVSSLGAKLLYDRATRPRVWVESAPYDPNLPIRGRYVSLRLLVDAPEFAATAEEKPDWYGEPATLSVEGDRLVAHRAFIEPGPSLSTVNYVTTQAGRKPALRDPVAYFIPEKVDDPSRRPPGETLWVEVTLPRKGPPRPIRLGVRRGDAPIEPLPLD